MQRQSIVVINYIDEINKLQQSVKIIVLLFGRKTITITIYNYNFFSSLKETNQGLLIFCSKAKRKLKVESKIRFNQYFKN